jgi:hypothetical protein
MSDKAFPRDPHLTSIAIAYKNPDVALIADAVLPRVPVGRRTFGYTTYPDAMMYDVPDTQVGEEGRMNRVRVQGTRVEGTVVDNGIVIPLTKSDVEDAPANVDPKDIATERATNIVLLDREKRVASLVFDSANYSAANKKDHDAGGNLRFDEANSDPVLEFIQGIDACLMRPNRLAIGAAVWSYVRVHPKVISACLGNTGGIVTRARLAEVLELSEVLVGTSRVNSAKPGKAASLVNLWGKAWCAFYSDRTVGTAGGITFGFTAEHGGRRHRGHGRRELEGAHRRAARRVPRLQRHRVSERRSCRSQR